MYFTKFNHCPNISLSSADNDFYNSWEQEEADGRIFRHCKYILSGQKKRPYFFQVTTRQCRHHNCFCFFLNSDHVFIDSRSGNITCLQIKQMKTNEREKETLTEFYAITGNNCTSSFFRKKNPPKKKIKKKLYWNCEVFRRFMEYTINVIDGCWGIRLPY